MGIKMPEGSDKPYTSLIITDYVGLKDIDTQMGMTVRKIHCLLEYKLVKKEERLKITTDGVGANYANFT